MPLQGQEPPTPASEDVDICHTDGAKCYSNDFGGFALEGTILTQAAQLRDALRADGVNFDDTSILFFSYDPPTRLSGRHNEVVFCEKGSKFGNLLSNLKAVAGSASEAGQAS